MNMTRRDFLKLCGAGAAMLGVGAKIAPPNLAPFGRPVPQPPRGGNGVLIDTTKCVGCQQCQIACQQVHSLPADKTERALCAVAPSVVKLANTSTDPTKPALKPV